MLSGDRVKPQLSGRKHTGHHSQAGEWTGCCAQGGRCRSGCGLRHSEDRGPRVEVEGPPPTDIGGPPTALTGNGDVEVAS